MSKKKKQRKIVKDIFLWWRANTGLSFWNINVQFADYLDGGCTAGSCAANWKYLNATLTFSDDAIKNMDRNELEELVVHEMMHMLLNEMREGKIKHEERVATQLQKAFMWVKGADK